MSINLSTCVQQGDIHQIKNIITNTKKELGFRWNFDYIFKDATRDAILLDNREIVQLFFEAGIDVNSYAHTQGDKGALTPLIHFAVRIGKLPMVQLMLEKGAKVKDTRHFGDEPDNQDGMRGAVEGGHVDVVECLLKNGADSSGYFGGYHSLSFFAKAAILGNEAMCQLLFEHGVDVKNSIDLTQEKYKDTLRYYFRYRESSDVEKKEELAKEYQDYTRAIRLMLDFAQGIDLGKEEDGTFGGRYNGLTFLEEIDVTGFNFVGVSMDGKPVSREDLVAKNIKGAEKALYTLSDLDTIEGERANKLKARLESAFQAKGRIVSHGGVVNLVPIETAVMKGDLDTVIVRLSNGVSPNQTSDRIHRKSILVEAAERGFEEIVKLLADHPDIDPKSIASAAESAKKMNFTKIHDFLTSRLDVNARDEKGSARIHNAIVAGNVEEVQQLIRAGADLTLRDKKSNSTLHLAIAPYGTGWGHKPTAQHIEILKLLLAGGVDPNKVLYSSPLDDAFAVGSVEAASLLMPLTEKKPNSENLPWYTELCRLALNKSSWRELLNLLKENGAEFKAHGNWSLLHRLVDGYPSYTTVNSTMRALARSIAGCEDRVNLNNDYQQLINNEKEGLQIAKDKLTYLMQNGAPIDNLVNGETALHSFLNNVDLNFMPGETTWVIEQFLQAGLNRDVTDEKGNTLLHTAAASGDVEAVTYLIKIGTNVNARNGQNRTPLHHAAAGKPESTKLLLDAGADPAAVDSEGLTPLQYSVQACARNDERYEKPTDKIREPYLAAQKALNMASKK